MVTIFLDLGENQTVQGWGSSPVSSKSVSIQLDQAHPFFMDNPFFYRYVEGKLVKDKQLVELFRMRQQQAQLQEAALNQESRIQTLEAVILELLGGM